MVQQHTEALDDGSYGHSFMRADEDAFETLVEYGYATYVNPDNPYAIQFIDEPVPDLIRTVADYEGLPEGTILRVVDEVPSVGIVKKDDVLVKRGGDFHFAGAYGRFTAEYMAKRYVCSVVRLGGDGQ